MHNNYSAGTVASDADLDDYAEPAITENGELLHPYGLHLKLSSALHKIGLWDDFGIRVLPNEEESYASIHFRIPAALPSTSASQLAEFQTQRIRYTDRDREWDALLGGVPISDRDRWSCFVDSVVAAYKFAHAAVESAVWAHARGEEWSWPYPAPGRVEAKYEMWGNDHPSTYDPHQDAYQYEESADVPHWTPGDDVQF